LKEENLKEACDCFYNAWNQTIHTLSTSEEIWEEWMQPTLGLHDQYISNYYIRRLLGYRGDDSSHSNMKLAVDCLHARAHRHNTTHCSLDNRFILHSVMAASSQDPNIYSLNITAGLEVSKRLLREQFDFILIDDFDSPITKKALTAAMFGKYTEMSSFGEANAGLMTNVGTNDYNDIMPPTILEKMRRENAADIALYEYAVELFGNRAREEGWDDHT